MRSYLLIFLALGWCSASLALAKDNPPPVPEGAMDVQARGPVHESFAQPTNTQPVQPDLVTTQPPDPVPEDVPDQKPDGDNMQWIPGYWAWDVELKDHIWVSGCWRQGPPKRSWVPGHWHEVKGGWAWVSGYWMPSDPDQVIQYLPPPPPTQDEGPPGDAPKADSIYVPGSWVYQETKYVWRPGYWVDYNPNWVWQPGFYVWTPAGCIYCEGFWDHPLAERGICFAPVHFKKEWWELKRHFVPAYTVLEDFLLGALFVGPHLQHYYFGDYFGDAYAKLGFVAWPDYYKAHKSFDPIFAFYHRKYSADPTWETGLRKLYAARQAGDVARPPRTLTLQAESLKKIVGDKNEKAVVGKEINITHVQNVTVLAPLKEIHNQKVTELQSLGKKTEGGPARVIKTQTVTKEEKTTFTETAGKTLQAGKDRAGSEIKSHGEGDIPLTHTDPPKKLTPPRIEAPKEKTDPPKKELPEHPNLPKVEPKPVPKFDPPKPFSPPDKKKASGS